LKSIEEYNINRNNIKVEIEEREINNNTRGVSVKFTDSNIRKKITFDSAPRNKAIYLSEKEDAIWRPFIKIFHKKYVDMHKEFMNNYSMHMENIDVEYLVEQSHFDYNHQYTIEKFTKTMIVANHLATSRSKKHFKHNQYLIRPLYYVRHSMNDDELINAINKTQEFLLNIKLENDALINKLNYQGLLHLNTINEIQDCSVCYDECSTITNCNHYLCANCYKSLIKKECPICRRPLQYARIVKEIQEQKAEPPVIEEQKQEPTNDDDEEEIHLMTLVQQKALELHNLCKGRMTDIKRNKIDEINDELFNINKQLSKLRRRRN